MQLETSYRLRLALKKHIREFFHQHDYLEVETPIVVQTPGTEVYLEYFKTSWKDYQNKHHNLWLRSSPEIHLKKVLSQGLPRIFEFALCFRNKGETSSWHHPEFTMLEWYQTNISFHDFITMTEELLQYTLKSMKKEFPYLITLNLSQKISRMSLEQAFREFAGIDLIDQDTDLAKKARVHGIVSVLEDDDFETAFFKILLEKIEPALKKLQAVVLYDYPASQAALAKVEGGVAKRFEFYIEGVELCNAFFEELNMSENKKRIITANHKRKTLGLETPGEDDTFYTALEKELDPCCGNALGFERLLALLLGEKNLDNTIPFRKQLPFYK